MLNDNLRFHIVTLFIISSSVISISTSTYIFDGIGCDMANLFQGSCIQQGNFSYPKNCEIFIFCKYTGALELQMNCPEFHIFLEKHCVPTNDNTNCPQKDCDNFFKVRNNKEISVQSQTTKRAYLNGTNSKRPMTIIKSISRINGSKPIINMKSENSSKNDHRNPLLQGLESQEIASTSISNKSLPSKYPPKYCFLTYPLILIFLINLDVCK